MSYILIALGVPTLLAIILGKIIQGGIKTGIQQHQRYGDLGREERANQRAQARGEALPYPDVYDRRAQREQEYRRSDNWFQLLGFLFWVVVTLGVIYMITL